MIHELAPANRAWVEKNGLLPYMPDTQQLAEARAWYAELVLETDAPLGPLFDSLREEAALDEETHEQLRALGYMK